MEKIRIEKISKKDFKAVSSLVEKEFPYLGVFDKKIENRTGRPEIFIFTAHYKDSFVGFIDFSLFEGTGMINGFSIKEKFRRRGFGKELLMFGLGFLKKNGAGKIRLLVRKENAVAKKIYEDAGFTFSRIHTKKINGYTVEEMELESGESMEKIFEKFVT